MDIGILRQTAVAGPRADLVPNGSALAAFAAAGIGSFAMGLLVLLDEADLFTAPTLYAPAGGVSGRTTLAVVAWLAAWVILHLRWRNRRLTSRRISAATLALVALGIAGTFPPLWSLL